MATRRDNYKTIDQLQNLIKELVRKYELATCERDDYLGQLNRVKQDLQIAKKKIAEQEKRLEHYELKQAFFCSETEQIKVNRRLTKLVKEIDKCIALLNG